MAGLLRRALAYAKFAWDREPVLVTAVVMGFSGPPLVYLSPLTYKQQEDLRNWPSAFNMYGLSTDLEKIYEDMPEKDPPTWTNNKWVNQEVEDE